MLCTYYSRLRPLGMGGYPDQASNPAMEVVNFESPQNCPRIGDQAWGYVTYMNPLPTSEVECYELTPGSIVPTEIEIVLALDNGLYYPAMVDGAISICLFGTEDHCGTPESFMIEGVKSVSAFWRDGVRNAARRVRATLSSLGADDELYKSVNLFAMNARLLADDIRKPKVTPVQAARINEMSRCDALAALLA